MTFCLIITVKQSQLCVSGNLCQKAKEINWKSKERFCFFVFSFLCFSAILIAIPFALFAYLNILWPGIIVLFIGICLVVMMLKQSNAGNWFRFSKILFYAFFTKLPIKRDNAPIVSCLASNTNVRLQHPSIQDPTNNSNENVSIEMKDLSVGEPEKKSSACNDTDRCSRNKKSKNFTPGNKEKKRYEL